MQYFGGKQRISKSLSDFLNKQLQEGQTFVDLFCGSCNVISKIDKNRQRIANDKHKYLIAMWKALQNGWQMPDSISEEEYKYIKEHLEEDMALSGFVGFGLSFGGKWLGGYCRNKENRNYCLVAKRSNEKILKNIMDVKFYNEDYTSVPIPNGALVYCDIPYRETTQYDKKETGIFDHEIFYQWVKDNSDKYEIYISEYKQNVPEGFDIVWCRNSKKDIRNKDNRREDTIEVLIKYGGGR